MMPSLERVAELRDTWRSTMPPARTAERKALQKRYRAAGERMLKLTERVIKKGREKDALALKQAIADFEIELCVMYRVLPGRLPTSW